MCLQATEDLHMYLPPILADRYRLVRTIGKGRSLVYEAVDQRLNNRRCAIKILDLNQDSREKIEHEINILATHALNLFFTPDIYDKGSDNAQAYIVMEYIEGETLTPTWDSTQVEQFVQIMLKYLVRLHATGIIHRDLKPQNIISTGNLDRPYVLIDFGIAKHGNETLTDAREQLSVNYAAPEQFTSTTDVRSDLFSLGATAYTLVVGRPPPNAMERLLNDTVIPPGQCVSNVSLALNTVIMEMLQLIPENRPPNAEAALKILDELSSETVQVDRLVSQTSPTFSTAINTDVHQPKTQSSINELPGRPKSEYQWLALLILGFIVIIGLQFIKPNGDIPLNFTRESTAQPSHEVSGDNPTTTHTANVDSNLPIITPTSTPIPIVSMCKDVSRKDLGGFDLLRDQGVIIYNHKSTAGAVLNDKVRVVKVYQNGLLIGYHATADNPVNGLSYLNSTTMMDCNTTDGTSGQNINAIAVDQSNRVWVGSESNGLVMFDRMIMRRYSEKDVLPSNEIFGLTAQENRVWIATRNGVATVENGETWDTPYQARQNFSIAFDDVHTVAIDGSGWIWIGHISNGISLLRKGQTWKHYPTDKQEFAGVKIRDILVLKKDGQEQVWIATADGGVILYQNDRWTTYDMTSGMPSNEVQDIAVDKYQRLWFATSKGVVFFDGHNWFTYNNLPTYSIAFGSASNPTCSGCRFDDDSVWTGTDGYGITYSRLPYPDQAINVSRICFWVLEKSQICPPITQSSLTVTATYTATLLQPGEQLHFFIEVIPQGGYDLSATRGDMLINIDPGNKALFGVHENIGVAREVAPGERYTFFQSDKPLVATDLDTCQRDGNELVCSSSWRLWIRTRHAGSSIRLVFRVSSPLSIPTITPHSS